MALDTPDRKLSEEDLYPGEPPPLSEGGPEAKSALPSSGVESRGLPKGIDRLALEASGTGIDVSTLIRQAQAVPGDGWVDDLKKRVRGLQQKEESELEPFTTDLKRRLTQDRFEAERQRQGIEPFDEKPWTKPPPEADPIKAFGSFASIFAIAASAFTHTPMINALNGAASAMTAIRQNDLDAYKMSYDQWKENTRLAIERHKMQHEDYKSAVEMMMTDVSAGNAMFRMLSAKYGDQATALMTEAGLDKDRAHLQEVRQSSALGLLGILPNLEKSAIQHEGFLTEVQSAKVIPDPRMRAAALNAAYQHWYGTGLRASGGAPTMAGLKAQLAMQRIDDKEAELGRPLTGAEKSQIIEYAVIETPDQREANAAQVATGMPITQVIPGWGPSTAGERRNARNDAVELIKKQNPGMSSADAGIELARRSVEFQAGKASYVALDKMLGATKQAVAQLDYNINMTKKEIARLGSSDLSPVINAIARGEERWTGEPAYSSLFFYMNATATESARILSGGQASIAQLHAGAMEEAQKWANINMTPASFDDVAQSMKAEGAERIRTYELAMQSQHVGGRPAKPESQSEDSESGWSATVVK